MTECCLCVSISYREGVIVNEQHEGVFDLSYQMDACLPALPARCCADA